jgi:hypothetical protein
MIGILDVKARSTEETFHIVESKLEHSITVVHTAVIHLVGVRNPAMNDRH